MSTNRVTWRSPLQSNSFQLMNCPPGHCRLGLQATVTTGYLRLVDMPVKDIRRGMGVSGVTFYQWRSRTGGLDASGLTPMK